MTGTTIILFYVAITMAAIVAYFIGRKNEKRS